MDDEKLGEFADQLHIFLPIFYRKVMAWHKDSEGLNPGHYMLLGTLMSRDSMSMSELGKRICASKPGMTFLIDRLIKEGKLERKYDVNDRRIIHVSLTAEGIAFMNEHRKEEKENIKKNLSKLSDEDLEALWASLETIKGIMSKANGLEENAKQE